MLNHSGNRLRDAASKAVVSRVRFVSALGVSLVLFPFGCASPRGNAQRPSGKSVLLMADATTAPATEPTSGPATQPCDLGTPNARVVAIKGGQLVAWDLVDGADGYIIYRTKANPGKTNTLIAAGVGPYNACGFIDPDPPEKGKYDGFSYLVIPFRANSASDALQRQPAYVDPPKPPPVPPAVTQFWVRRKNFGFGQPGGGTEATVEVTWMPVDDAVWYRVEIYYEMAPDRWEFWENVDVSLKRYAKFVVPNQQQCAVTITPFNAARENGPATKGTIPSGDAPQPH
jgi:hypothetical protein